MSGLKVYPSDGFHSLTLGALTITLNAAAFVYDSSGRSLFERFGYDRRRNLAAFATATPNYSGASNWDGPPYNVGYQFEWNLQLVKESTYFGLLALQERQQTGKGLIRFVDYLWPIQEDQPRTRAKKGALLTPFVAGTDFFYPQFNLVNFKIEEETPWQQENRYKDGWTIKITATEGDLDVPVPTSADIA